jgi:general secretion pathway protein I
MADERGFTLIEVLVALIISALLLAAMIDAVELGLNATRQAGRYQEAVSRCRSHLAGLGPDVARLAGVSSGDDGSGFRWQLSVRRLGGPPGTPLALYAVAATISWGTNDALRQVTLATERLGSAAPSP